MARAPPKKPRAIQKVMMLAVLDDIFKYSSLPFSDILMYSIFLYILSLSLLIQLFIIWIISITTQYFERSDQIFRFAFPCLPSPSWSLSVYSRWGNQHWSRGPTSYNYLGSYGTPSINLNTLARPGIILSFFEGKHQLPFLHNFSTELIQMFSYSRDRIVSW